MSKARIPIVGVSHHVILPGVRRRIALSNYSESNLSSVSRTRKLKIFGIVTYKDPDHKVMYSYGTLVGIISESPIARSDTFFSSIFSNSFGTSYSNEWQLVVIGVERFKILSMTEENGVYFASIQIEKVIFKI